MPIILQSAETDFSAGVNYMVVEILVACALAFAVGWFLFKRNQKKIQIEKDSLERRRLENQARKFRDRGENIGGRIFNALRKAAENHPGYKDRVCYANVMKMADNAGYFSVIVKFEEPGVFKHLQATFQVDVPLIEGLRDNQICVLEGNYGPNNYYPLTEEALALLLSRLEVKTWSWPNQQP